jgi:selenide,water dikinase
LNTVGQPAAELVLVGGGHSHLPLLKSLAMKPIKGFRVSLVSRDIHTPYSGMLPGLIAGHYRSDQCHFDLRRLAQLAGIRFIHASALRLDLDNKLIALNGRPDISYDLLSINTGSRPASNLITGANQWGHPVKPIDQFLKQWESFSQQLAKGDHIGPIVCVGGGAASVEVVLAMRYRLRKLGVGELDFHLVCGSETVLPNYDSGARQRILEQLDQSGIQLHTDVKVIELQQSHVILSDGSKLASSFTALAVDAMANPWLDNCNLASDERGFILVDDCLQSTSHPGVFAAGDNAHFGPQPLPKAGVYAVRQGPVLAGNLRRLAAGKSLRPYRPQTNFLSLLTAGGQYAVANKGGWSAEGKLLWRWKNHIDTRFMARFQVADKAAPPAATQPDMHCGGCGAKVASDSLSRVLATIDTPTKAELITGPGDDAALLRLEKQRDWLQTVDYIRSFIDDPYLLGRVGALHCLSDIYAMGALPHSAQAIVNIEFADKGLVEDDLRSLMAGICETLRQEDTALAGGHSSEGAETGMGLVVNGFLEAGQALAKGPLTSNQALILSKPLGTGVLLAANQQAQCKGKHLQGALQSMLQSNRQALAIMRDYQPTACTDITGFGLLGHLGEMLAEASTGVYMQLDVIPVLAGAIELSKRGYQSTLAPDNQTAANLLEEARPDHATYPLLFDPQTSGGLLAAIPAEVAMECCQKLRQAGYQAAVIGNTSEDISPGKVKLV